jgi:hypothetical protein
VELIDQIRARPLRLNAIVVAIRDRRHAGRPTRRTGSAGAGGAGHRQIDIDAEPERVRRDGARLALEAGHLLGVDAVAREAVEVVAGFAGAAYGLPTDDMREAVEQGLIGLIRSGQRTVFPPRPSPVQSSRFTKIVGPSRWRDRRSSGSNGVRKMCQTGTRRSRQPVDPAGS